jgi:glycosyltransferase involved in cell wall biosynthesis
MTKRQTDLSIIVPTRDDEKLIGLVLDRVAETARGLGCEFEIIVADAGSADRTREIASEKGADSYDSVFICVIRVPFFCFGCIVYAVLCLIRPILES